MYAIPIPSAHPSIPYPSSPLMPSHVIFDLGGVLIDWDPRRAYRQLGGTEAEIEHFLEHVATS